MTDEVDDHARLALRESMRWVARELEQLAKSLSGEHRRQVQALSSEARQIAEILDRMSRKLTDHTAVPPDEPNQRK